MLSEAAATHGRQRRGARASLRPTGRHSSTGLWLARIAGLVAQNVRCFERSAGKRLSGGALVLLDGPSSSHCGAGPRSSLCGDTCAVRLHGNHGAGGDEWRMRPGRHARRAGVTVLPPSVFARWTPERPGSRGQRSLSVTLTRACHTPHARRHTAGPPRQCGTSRGLDAVVGPTSLPRRAPASPCLPACVPRAAVVGSTRALCAPGC